MSEKKFVFKMDMTCDGCSNAAKRVLEKNGMTEIDADWKAKLVTVKSSLTEEELVKILEKTGKTVETVSVE